jgi:hypothetical protein
MSNEVPEVHHLGPQQCGNQTAYGLPGERYCANYREPGFEFCRGCCQDIQANYPNTDVKWRGLPYSMLTHFSPSGDIFVWPQRGQVGDEQHGHVFVFSHESYWAKQTAHGVQSLREDFGGGTLCHWEEVLHVYEGPFRELGGFHGVDYTLESLKKIARVYGKPVPAKS